VQIHFYLKIDLRLVLMAKRGMTDVLSSNCSQSTIHRSS